MLVKARWTLYGIIALIIVLALLAAARSKYLDVVKGVNRERIGITKDTILWGLSTQAFMMEIDPPHQPTNQLVPLLRINARSEDVVLRAADLESGCVLDSWGNSIWVRQTPTSGDSWVFVSNGPNGRYDDGFEDDIVKPWPPPSPPWPSYESCPED